MSVDNSVSPKSLLEFAGVTLEPGTFDDSALLLIDFQVEYIDGSLPLDAASDAVRVGKALLDRARERHAPVFHVVHHARPGSTLFDPHGPNAGIIPELAPEDGETVVVKALPNAFAGTELKSLIDKTGRKNLIVAGFMTHLCVSTTVRAALDLGYKSTVVASATATRDLRNPVGDVVPAGSVQSATLSALADRFAVVVNHPAALV